MKDAQFSIRRFKNRNGVISWRVQGVLSGVRLRRNFKTPEAAAAEKASLEIKATFLLAPKRKPRWMSSKSRPFKLRPATVARARALRLHEAEAVVRRLAGNHAEPF